MAKISTPKLHLQFAKAKEARGAYQDALVAYERARDLETHLQMCGCAPQLSFSFFGFYEQL